MSEKVEYDCIICGAGIAGLLTGAALSRVGLKILMLEKAPHTGGRSRCIEKDGYLVDMGLHVIRYCKKSPTANIFKKMLGKKEKLKFAELGQAKLFHNSQWYDYPLSASAIQSTTFFNDAEKEQFLKILSEEIVEGDPEAVLEKSVKDWIDETEKKYKIKPGNARLFLETLSRFMLVSYGNLDKLSAGELIAGIQLGLKASAGACYPIGSWKPFIERLEEIIRENGEIRTKVKVEKVMIENGKVIGVQVEGKTLESKLVIVNIPSQEIFSVLDEKLFPENFVKKCKNLIPTTGVSLDYGLKKQVSDFAGSIISTEPFIMGIFTSNLDPSVAPEGEQLFTIFRPTPIEEVINEQKASEVVESTEKLLNIMFPELLKNVKWRRVLKLRMVDGAIPFITQHRNARPSVKSEVIEGLYFTGDTYNGPGTGGEIAHASAELCITTIMKDLNLEFSK